MRGTLTVLLSQARRTRFIPAGAGNTEGRNYSGRRLSVHPRGCGEHGREDCEVARLDGSSPRVRGTRRSGRPGHGQIRFIPAGAGNTRLRKVASGRRAVHPRGCGEHSAADEAFGRGGGSSPRVRGTLLEFIRYVRPPRFIPAGAGNTRALRTGYRRRSVHPRGCGEHPHDHAKRRPSTGSSPRVRGTHPLGGHHLGGPRFIPAGAGNTLLDQPHGMPTPVHPRGCGEHIVKAAFFIFNAGSSPRVRGTPRVVTGRDNKIRFIPAGAGNTLRATVRAERSSVHPRGCGEHLSRAVAENKFAGSSPRVRGTQPGGRAAPRHPRFIPAGAGNTAARRFTGWRRAVHPRGCGEHREPKDVGACSAGSSPRVRGTRIRRSNPSN